MLQEYIRREGVNYVGLSFDSAKCKDYTSNEKMLGIRKSFEGQLYSMVGLLFQ